MQKRKENKGKNQPRDDLGMFGNIGRETKKKFPKFPKNKASNVRIQPNNPHEGTWVKMNENPP